jgi:plastocyanin
MYRISRASTAGQAAVAGALALALACSEGSGPGNGPTTGSISGAVSSAGDGVAGAEIALTGASTGSQTTAADGTYLFDDLEAGSYTVTLTLPAGFSLGTGEAAARPVTHAAGEDATIDWSAVPTDPTTGTIEGSVTAGDQGVGDATITLAGTSSGSATTSAAGTYAFPNLQPGDYTVAVTLPSGFSLDEGETAAKAATVTAGETETVSWSAVQEGGAPTVVTLSGTSFSPSNVTIAVGETVRWVVGNGSHTVTPDNPGQPGVWSGTGLLGAGQQFEFTFTTAGEYDYHCIPHESLGMTGTITVQ